MSSAPRHDPPLEPCDSLLQPSPESLGELVRAFLLARRQREDRWQFAISLTGLRRAGLDDTHLRWLMLEGHVEHGLEQTEPAATERQFQHPPNVCFTRASCFVLTERGRAFAQATASRRPTGATPSPKAAARKAPCWDGDSRLFVGRLLVKHFRQDAPAQKAILSAFQEEGWPPWIHNPLAGEGEREGEERLHDAINNLNRLQKVARLHFRVEGGDRVYWELLPSTPPVARATPKRHPSDT